MGLLSSVAAFFGVGVSGNIRYEAVDVDGQVWKGVFYDVQAYGMSQDMLLKCLSNHFYSHKGIKLQSLKLLGYA